MTIPAELKALPQWIVWRAEKRDSGKVAKVPVCPHNGLGASVTDPSHWGTFEQASAVADRVSGLGFVFTEVDPYVFVDLDATDDPAELELQRSIYENVVSYAERSHSGKGLHIIAKGSLPQGVRARGVELYPHGRFAVMTGNVFRDSPIRDCSVELTSLYQYLTTGRLQNPVASTLDGEQVMTDEELWTIAFKAKDGPKFEALWKGHWHELGYPSQSEADQALVNIIAFYTDNRAQVARLFCRSGLMREKVTKNRTYLPNMVTKSFDRKPPPIDLRALERSMREELARRQGSGAVEAHQADLPVLPKVDPREMAKGSRVTFPPGLLGDVAKYIYASAPRPLEQVALVAAIGLLAGIAGRCYTVSNTGLNQYMILLGSSGVGKDAMSGISTLAELMCTAHPGFGTFFGPSEIASSQALFKHLSDHPSFLSQSGEIGHLLRDMNGKQGASHLYQLKRMMLRLYSLSAPGKGTGNMVFADRDKNVKGCKSPAFTWLGETTQETFFSSITEQTVKEGFIPRMLVLECPQDWRPSVNRQHEHAVPSSELMAGLCELAAHSMTQNGQNQHQKVRFDEGAEAVLGIDGTFNAFCDRRWQEAEREVMRDLWNRAWLKAAKLAALVAVGINYVDPCITIEAANWAIAIVLQDINGMLSRFSLGEVLMEGVESQQVQRVTDVVREWYVRPWDEVSGYAPGLMNLHAAKLVPYSYLSRKCIGTACFKSDRVGASYSIKRTIQQLCDRGDLEEFPDHYMKKQFGHGGKAYLVKNLHTFKLGD